MSLYNLEVKLPVNNKGRTNKLTIHDFTKETIHLINDYYEKDFDKFGYKKKYSTDYSKEQNSPMSV